MAAVRRPLPLNLLACRVGATSGSSPHLRAIRHERTFIDSLLSSALGPTPLRSVTHTKTLPYSSKAIFKAVSDVSGYPGFLPFTISSHVIERDSAGFPKRARLRVGYDKLGLEEDWDSVVTCNPSEGLVEAKSSETASQGLFEVLKTRWKIVALEAGTDSPTEVKLDVDVKFRNPVYDQMFSQFEQKVGSAMISAFEKRVKELDGK